MLVGIGVMRLHPGDQVLGSHRIVPGEKRVSEEIGLVEDITQGMAIGACGEVDILGILLLLDISVLKHLAIDEE